MKYVVITGASSGIGKKTALELAKRGKNLIVAARREALLEDLKKEINQINASIDVVIRIVDLSKSAEVYEFYNSIKDYEIEIFINNAGVAVANNIESTPTEQLENLLAINVNAPMILSSLFVKDYKDKVGAQLINVSSVLGYVMTSGDASYTASKYFINAFTESLAKELVNSNLKIKVFAPTLTATEMTMGVGNLSENKQLPPYLKTVDETVNNLLNLIDSNKVVGVVGKNDEFVMLDKYFPSIEDFG